RVHRFDARRRLRGARHALVALGQHRDRLRDPRPRAGGPPAGPARRDGMTAADLTAVATERATSAIADLRDLARRLRPDPELYAESAKALSVLFLAAIIFVAVFPLFGSTSWLLRLEQGL